MQNSYEASWFLSALAQCAAAIAAIVGGFITTYLLSHSQEKRRLENELKSACEEYAGYHDQHHDAKQYAKRLIQHMYLIQVRRRILTRKKLLAGPAPAIPELRQRYRCDIGELGLSVAAPDWLDNQIGDLQNVRRQQVDEFAKQLISSLELPDVSSALGDLWASDLEYVEDRISEFETTYPPERAQIARQRLKDIQESLPAEKLDYRADDIKLAVSRDQGEIDELKRQMGSASEAMHTSKLKADIARKRLIEPLPIREVKWGLACVALILGPGVVLPLVFLAWEGFASQANLRWVALGLFCFSLAILVAYLIWLTRRLVSASQKSESTSE